MCIRSYCNGIAEKKIRSQQVNSKGLVHEICRSAAKKLGISVIDPGCILGRINDLRYSGTILSWPDIGVVQSP